MKKSTVFPILPLGKICILHSGGTPRRSNNKYYGGNIPWAKIADLDTENGIVVDTEEYITVEGLQAINNRIFPKGSILLAMYGSIGKLAIAGRDISCNQAILGIQIKDKEHLDINYLRLWLTSIKATLEFQGRGVTQQNISKSIVEKLEIPLPPLEEQRRIAAILDKADGVRRKRKEAIRLTDELLKSTFLEMFGDPVTNPKGWEVRELGDCVKDIESGWSPKCDTRQAEPEEWGVLKLGAVTYGHFNPDENKAMLPDDVPRQELEIKTGDLLVTRKNTYELVGASAFVQMTRPKLMLPDLIFRLRLIDGIDPVYVWQTLSQKTMRLKLSGLAGGTAGSMPNISKARLRTLPFPVPPQLLQLKYREIFNQFWLKKEHQKESEEISENLFNSLLQRAFRGEL
ncbi:restriction endonuclease subunit S [Microcystis aeruginosa]|uniref:Type-1 restriction enzyme EcoKI specificity protein n=1 Tax=Microcystis aeruginosa NIES-4285 TaxID=2497681 RepID=A0A402D7Q2_MICAE|nr:restriction endonuclease subunit S [Microcystis aeruginosa]GCE58211.1 type-1 restriction enzyme EcoKI specificity protein [Microcystis aeruginosa NIES-4285]